MPPRFSLLGFHAWASDCKGEPGLLLHGVGLSIKCPGSALDGIYALHPAGFHEVPYPCHCLGLSDESQGMHACSPLKCPITKHACIVSLIMPNRQAFFADAVLGISVQVLGSLGIPVVGAERLKRATQATNS